VISTPARVLILCPTTGEKVPTVLKLKPEGLDSLRGGHAFRCDKCGQVHQWSKEDAWLESPRQR